MATDDRSREQLLAENEELRLRLEEAEEVLQAIGSGAVDALVVSRPEGEQIYTLKGAEHCYQVLVESMNEGAATLGPRHTILYSNRRLAEMLDVPLEKLIGSQMDSYVSPQNIPTLEWLLNLCSEKGGKGEVELVTGAGRTMPALISSGRLDLGDCEGVSLIVTDLSEQKRAEEVMAAERLARSILEQAGEAILVCDENGRVIRTSRQVHQLCSGKQPAGHFDELLPLKIVENNSPFSIAAPLRGETFSNVEVVCRQPDDRRYHLLLNATPLQNRQGQIVGSVVALADITKRKEAEEILRRAHDELEQRVQERTADLTNALSALESECAERIKTTEELRQREQILIHQSRMAAMGEMIGNIAHQWRQPLNTLGLLVQQAAIHYESFGMKSELIDSNVAKSMQLIKHMSRTIDDFRNFFRIDKQKVEFNVRKELARTLSLMEGSLLQIQIKIEERDDPVVLGFPNEFSQVLLNILNNAKDALVMRGVPEPRVMISIRKEDNRAVVTIADNAGGIDERIIAKIFDPYFTTKGPQSGTGVGLFMSKTIIEKNMGGRLTVRNIDGGAEFRIEV